VVFKKYVGSSASRNIETREIFSYMEDEHRGSCYDKQTLQLRKAAIRNVVRISLDVRVQSLQSAYVQLHILCNTTIRAFFPAALISTRAENKGVRKDLRGT
jgi:hypothetical protein